MAFVNEFAKDNNKRRINMEEDNLSDDDSSGKWILGGNGQGWGVRGPINKFISLYWKTY